MNVAITVDRTSSGKEHFEVLDGLRGTAAFLIVLFHVFNYPFGFRCAISATIGSPAHRSSVPVGSWCAVH
jgi:peptidoglycan/LPS O-acetylase OafA/YrhL